MQEDVRCRLQGHGGGSCADRMAAESSRRPGPRPRLTRMDRAISTNRAEQALGSGVL